MYVGPARRGSSGVQEGVMDVRLLKCCANTPGLDGTMSERHGSMTGAIVTQAASGGVEEAKGAGSAAAAAFGAFPNPTQSRTSIDGIIVDVALANVFRRKRMATACKRRRMIRGNIRCSALRRAAGERRRQLHAF
jgi:hypothetical protein